jgi:hypothetical protein
MRPLMRRMLLRSEGSALRRRLLAINVFAGAVALVVMTAKWAGW